MLHPDQMTCWWIYRAAQVNKNACQKDIQLFVGFLLRGVVVTESF